MDSKTDNANTSTKSEIDDLCDKISAVKQKNIAKDLGDKSASSSHALASRMVIDLFAGIAFGGSIGYWLDNVFATKPFMFIIFGIIGILAGFLNMYRTSQREDNYETQTDKNQENQN